MLRIKNRAASQVTFDMDYNVPDAKPDIGRMIQNKGDVTMEEVRLNDGHAFLRGNLNVDLLYHEGSFKIASKTGCPIVPIAMNNTAEIFEAHFPKVKPCHVVIEYCAPVYVKDLDRDAQKHLGTYTRNIIQETIRKNQSLVQR